MARNGGMLSRRIGSSAEANELDSPPNLDTDDSFKSMDCSLSQQLDIEVHKLEGMVKCLEELERALTSTGQNKQTTSDNEETSGGGYGQLLVMDKTPRSGIPIPRRSGRAVTAHYTSTPVGSPPLEGHGHDVPDGRVQSPIWPLSPVSQGTSLSEVLPPDSHYNADQMEDDADSYAESVSVKSTAKMFGGQAVIRSIPTPNSKRRQVKKTPDVPYLDTLMTGEQLDAEMEDVLDRPLRSLSEINGIDEFEELTNGADGKVDEAADDEDERDKLDEVNDYILDPDIDNDNDSEEEEVITKIGRSNINKELSTTVKQLTKQYTSMDYTVLGRITPLNENKRSKTGQRQEEMSFVLGRPMSPSSGAKIQQPSASQLRGSKPTVPRAEPKPVNRVPASRRSQLPPIAPRKNVKQREVTNHVGIMCEGCNNCLLELKRQALRILYPDGEAKAQSIETIEGLKGKLHVNETAYRFTSGGRCDVCDTNVDQLKAETVSMVQSIQQAQTRDSTTTTNLPNLIGSINVPPITRKLSSVNGTHIRYRGSKVNGTSGHYLSKSAPIGVQAQVYLEHNVRSRPTQKRQMLVRSGSQDRGVLPRTGDMYPGQGPQEGLGVSEVNRQPLYPVPGSNFFNTPYMQQAHPMQVFHQQQQQQQHHQQQQQQFFQQQYQQQQMSPQHQLHYQQQYQHQLQQQQQHQQQQQQQLQQQQQFHYHQHQQQQYQASPHLQYLHHSHSAPGSPVRIQSPPPRMSRISSPPPSSPSLSRLSTMSSPPPSASPAASFFARAAQKLSKRKKRHHPPDPEPPPFPTRFSEILRLLSPPCPPILLRGYGRSQAPGIGKVKVMLRVVSTNNHGDQAASFLTIDARNKQVTVHDPAASGYATSVAHRKAAMAPKMFAFDGVFSPDDCLAEVCAGSLPDIIQGVVAGADGCVFTYGYSKLGKTYTMIGQDESSQTLGVLPCAIAWLFKVINEQKDQTGARFSVRVSAVEVSGKQETLKDLLADVAQGQEAGMGTAPGVYLREDPISGTQLENQSELRAPTAEKAAYYLDAALNSMNKSEDEGRSSHLLFTLHVYQYRLEKENKAGLPGVAGGRSRLHLIDLGSSSKSKDPNNVALSLSALGNVIMALLNGQRHVPHRDSKVAQLLRDSLGNITCRTCMIAHVSQEIPHYNESLQVIQLAARVHRMRRRKVRGQFSGTSSDDSSTDGSSIRSRPYRGFRMGTLHEGSSLSDPDYTSSSEQSCDTVIYLGQNGQSLSDREFSDHEGPPRAVPRTNPRLPRRASGSRSSGDEGSNSDSGRSLYRSHDSLVLKTRMGTPVRDVSVTRSRHGTPVRSLSRGTTPVPDSPQQSSSPSSVSFNLPRKMNARTKTMPSKPDASSSQCYAGSNVGEKAQRSGARSKRSNSLSDNMEPEQWIDGPGATIYPEKQKSSGEQWVDGPTAFVVKPEPKKSSTKMSSEEMWVDGPPEMLAENQTDENQNHAPKMVLMHTSSKKAGVKTLSPKHQSPMNSPALMPRQEKSKASWPLRDIKERTDKQSFDQTQMESEARPDSMITNVGDADDLVQSELVKPFVRDWVEKHGVSEKDNSLGFMMDSSENVIGTLETFRRNKPHDTRTKKLLASSSTPKQSPQHSPKGSPSNARKTKPTTTVKLPKAPHPPTSGQSKRVSEWLKSVDCPQHEETIYMEGIVGKAMEGAIDNHYETIDELNASQDISSGYPDTSLNDSRTHEYMEADISKTEESLMECNIGDVSFDSSIDTTNSVQNRDSIYEMQMDEQLEKALTHGAAKCDVDDETFSNSSCAKDESETVVRSNAPFLEYMETIGDMKKSDTIQSIKTLVAEPSEVSENSDIMCNVGQESESHLLNYDLDPTSRLLSRKPDGASNPNLICESFSEKTNIGSLRDEYLINNAIASQSADYVKRSGSRQGTLGRQGDGDGQMEDVYWNEKGDSVSPLKSQLSNKVCPKCGYSQQNSKPISKMCKDCQKMVALSIKNSHSSAARRDKDKSKHVVYANTCSAPASSKDSKSSKSKSQSPSHSRLPIFSKNLQTSSKDSKLSRKKDKEGKKSSGCVNEFGPRTPTKGQDSDSGNDSGIVAVEKTLLSPYATVTKPRTVSHSSSGHGSDNSSNMSTDLISKQGSSSDKQHGGTSSGYESMLRDSENSGSSTAHEDSADEQSSGDKKKSSKKKRLPSTRRSRSAPARSTESPESSSRKSSPSNKSLSPSSKAWLEKHKLKEEPFELKEYDAEDVKRMTRLRLEEESGRRKDDKGKVEQELPVTKEQYIVDRSNWRFDCKFLMCFSCRSRKTDV